jgi:hypothetical protein
MPTRPEPTVRPRVRDPLLAQIVRAYDDPVVHAYCWGRFGILRQRFLSEIGQYLPPEGLVLDVGCGFGLFSLYYVRKGSGCAPMAVANSGMWSSVAGSSCR